MADRSVKAVWVKVLKETPLPIRRRASAYLKNIKKTSEKKWLIWSDDGARYRVVLEKGGVMCSCPYSQQGKGPCKHVCAVAAHELTKINVMPWLKKLEERL